MMTEVSIADAYDAHLLGSLVDEEDEDRILATALTAGRLTVITSKSPVDQETRRFGNSSPHTTKACAARLSELNLRLEEENDDLARQILRDKAALRTQLDLLESRVELLNEQLRLLSARLRDTDEERRHAHAETTQLKELCRRELSNAEQAYVSNHATIATYKQMSSRLSAQLEELSRDRQRHLELVTSRVRGCDRCSMLLSDLLTHHHHHQQQQQQHHHHQEHCEPGTSSGCVAVKLPDEVIAEAVPAKGGDKVAEEEDEVANGEVLEDVTVQRTESPQQDEAGDEAGDDDDDEDAAALRMRLGSVRRELAASKLKVVEAECTIQDLQHRLSVTRNEMGSKRASWFFNRPQNSTTQHKTPPRRDTRDGTVPKG